MDDAGGQAHDEGGGEDVLRPFEELPGDAVGIVPGGNAREDAEGEEQGRNLFNVPRIAEGPDDEVQHREQQHGQDEIPDIAPQGNEGQDNIAERHGG